MNLQSILNKNVPWAHTELELNILGVSKNNVGWSKEFSADTLIEMKD
jgi:hypothetical protein